jgi:hypothetical protein
MAGERFEGGNGHRLSKSAACNYDFFDAPFVEDFVTEFLPSNSSAFDRVSCEVRHLLISLRNARALSEFSFVELSMA